MAEIKTRYYQLQQAAHPDKFAQHSSAEQRAALLQASLINDAYQILSSPIKRAIYILKLQGIDAGLETDTAMDSTFLMTQMELRERIADKDKTVLSEIEQSVGDCEKQLQSQLDNPSASSLLKAREIVRQMQFYLRLIEELEE